MKKALKTSVITLLILSMVAVFLPSFSMTANAAYYAKDINGKNVSKADFIIDPGHGGKDPGACLGNRHEADDVLRMAKRVGQLIIASGATVAFTRITDVFVELSDRANIQKAGTYSCFVSFHRNAASGTAYGLETYHYPNSSTGQTLATQLQNALVALNIWRNRGVKSANYAVLRQTTIPAALIEIGFIDN
ncbi:MAG: N-acetylmuramoyl-L-alanine amidase, partial [Clostridia bacterium]|nr:N-acetylmuramoyl-L-alanine amidase [Clostridia bacterium]